MSVPVVERLSLVWRPCRFTCPVCGQTLAYARAGSTNWYAHRHATWPVEDRALAALATTAHRRTEAVLWLSVQGFCEAVHAVLDDPGVLGHLEVVRLLGRERSH